MWGWVECFYYNHVYLSWCHLVDDDMWWCLMSGPGYWWEMKLAREGLGRSLDCWYFLARDSQDKWVVSVDIVTGRLMVIKLDCSTLIGGAPALLRSHWSRASLVMLAPAVLCHKEPARRIQSPLLGALERKIPPTRGILLAPRWFFMS